MNTNKERQHLPYRNDNRLNFRYYSMREICVAILLVVLLVSIGMSYVVSRVNTRHSDEYKRYLSNEPSPATSTRKVDFRDAPPFVGVREVPGSMLSVPTTYVAIACGVILIVLAGDYGLRLQREMKRRRD